MKWFKMPLADSEAWEEIIDGLEARDVVPVLKAVSTAIANGRTTIDLRNIVKFCGVRQNYAEKLLPSVQKLLDFACSKPKSHDGFVDDSATNRAPFVHGSLTVHERSEASNHRGCNNSTNNRLEETRVEEAASSSNEEPAATAEPPPIVSNKNEGRASTVSDVCDEPPPFVKKLAKTGTISLNSATDLIKKLGETYGFAVVERAMAEVERLKPKKPAAYLQTVCRELKDRVAVEAEIVAQQTVEATTPDGKVVKITSRRASKLMKAKAVKELSTGKVYRGDELRLQTGLPGVGLPAFQLPCGKWLTSMGMLAVVAEGLADFELQANHWALRVGHSASQRREG